MSERSRSLQSSESSKVGALGAALIFGYVLYAEFRDRRQVRTDLSQRKIRLEDFLAETVRHMYGLERDDRDGLGGGPLARGFDESMHANRDLYPDLPFGPLTLDAIKEEWDNPQHPEIHRAQALIAPLAGSVVLLPEGIHVQNHGSGEEFFIPASAIDSSGFERLA